MRVVVFVLALIAILATPAQASNDVTLCHALGMTNKDGYQSISIAAAGAFNGHLGSSQNHQTSEDIIPPFEFQGQTYSQNWFGEYIIIYNNGRCDGTTITPTTIPPTTIPPTETPTATSTDTPTETTTPTETLTETVTTTPAVPTVTESPSPTPTEPTVPTTLPNTGTGQSNHSTEYGIILLALAPIVLLYTRRKLA